MQGGVDDASRESQWERAAHTSARNESLEMYLVKRISGVGPFRAKQLVSKYGAGVLEVMDRPPAAAKKELATLRGVGPVTATKMKASWEATKRTCAQLLAAASPCAAA
jgi:predicted flap endonuclease-1-like 5' DNA nuclease